MDLNQPKSITINSTDVLKKQLKFIAIMQQIYGVIMIVIGAISCIGILSAIVGIPIILAGVKLFKSGNTFGLAANFDNEQNLIEAIENLHGYWKFSLIALICSILFFIIYMILIIALISSIGGYY